MKDVIIITGATASGKAKLAFLLAKALNSEIIVADSMKVYKEADIATCKPSAESRKKIKYHLLDIIKADQRYDAGKFCSDSTKIIDNLHKKNIVPIVAGGTSLYCKCLIDGIAQTPEISNEIMNDLEAQETSDLYENLKKKDPERAGQIHPNMRKRIIRALAIFNASGKTMTSFLSETHAPDYKFTILSIDWPRDVLYERINKRFDRMVEQGLETEVRMLHEKYGSDSAVFKGVGYKELLPYIEGKISFLEAVDSAKKASRNYAKRQLTWTRQTKEVLSLNGQKLQELNSYKL